MIKPGVTFLSPNPDYPTEHLYIIISPIIEERVLFVNVTTKKESSDTTCILKKGDHPFIRHDSVINYGDAKDTEVKLIKKAIETKLFALQDPISDALLKRIQQGALTSPAFTPKYLKYIPRK